MVESSKKLTAENEKMRDRDRMLKLQVKIREEERDSVLEKSMIQSKVNMNNMIISEILCFLQYK